MVAIKGSRAQVMHGNADKTNTGLRKSQLIRNPKTGKYVSKAKSLQARKRRKGNLKMQLRSQAVKEVTKGRKDSRDIFKKGSKINKDINVRYQQLLEMNADKIKKAEASNKTLKNKVNSNRKRSRRNSRKANKGGFFY